MKYCVACWLSTHVMSGSSLNRNETPVLHRGIKKKYVIFFHCCLNIISRWQTGDPIIELEMPLVNERGLECVSLESSRRPTEMSQNPFRSYKTIFGCKCGFIWKDSFQLTAISLHWFKDRVSATLPFTTLELWPSLLPDFCQLTLDSNTVFKNLSVRAEQSDCWTARTANQPERFVLARQVLCERLCLDFTGRLSGVGKMFFHQSQDISRSSKDSGLGNNDKSSSLECNKQSYWFRHSNIKTVVSGH